MPFVSKKQEAWAFANKKPFAKKWADMTDQKSLPNYAGGMESIMSKKKAKKKSGKK